MMVQRDRAMPVLDTQLNPRSEGFKANARAMQALVDDLDAHLARVAQGGGAEARARHLARGKLLPRDRIAQLLDIDVACVNVKGKTNEKLGYLGRAEAIETQAVCLLVPAN